MISWPRGFWPTTTDCLPSNWRVLGLFQYRFSEFSDQHQKPVDHWDKKVLSEYAFYIGGDQNWSAREQWGEGALAEKEGATDWVWRGCQGG